MSEEQPEELIQPIMVVSPNILDDDDEDHAEDFASASGPDVFVFRILGSEASPYPDDMLALPRGFLAAARERRCGSLGVKTEGGGAVLPTLPTFGGG